MVIPFFRRRTFMNERGGSDTFYMGGYVHADGTQEAVIWHEDKGVVYRGRLVPTEPLAYPIDVTKEEYDLLGLTVTEP